MAKRVIQPGSTTHRGTCGECGCRFTYEASDVHHNYVRGGEYVGCPTCGHSCRHFGRGDRQER